MVVSQGGNYTKHIYMGSQRITSKVSNSRIFGTSPVNTTELQAKLTLQTTNIKERFDSLGVKYSGAQQTGGLVSASPATTADSYFYHPDHLGSSSLITNKDGYLVQHIQYVPFGEVFVEERNATWSTPYKFNGKEQDEETGLCYYGARYYDPRTSVWLSVDPLAEKYPNMSSYVYCANNPVNYIDPDGRDWFKDKDGSYQFNPALHKNNASKILTEGQSYAFKSKTLNDKNGKANYRKDGSIMFSNETDAYNRMWTSSNGSSAKREFGKKGREEFGIVKENGVLVVPNWKNEPGSADPSDYGYEFNNGGYKDPLTGQTESYVGTIHTHQSPNIDNYYDLSTEREGGDVAFAKNFTPLKPVIAIGRNGGVYGATVNSKTGNAYDLKYFFRNDRISRQSILNGFKFTNYIKKLPKP